MNQQVLVNLAAASVPLVVGFIWYSLLFGKMLRRVNGTEGGTRPPAHIMALAFLLTYAASYIIAWRVLGGIVIHQHALFGMLAHHPEAHEKGTELNAIVTRLMEIAGQDFRTFKHGAFHGSFLGLCLVFPVLSIIALFEPKPITWVLIHSVYWIICLALMGGIICQYMP
jgi:hypothetical protein